MLARRARVRRAAGTGATHQSGASTVSPVDPRRERAKSRDAETSLEATSKKGAKAILELNFERLTSQLTSGCFYTCEQVLNRIIINLFSLQRTADR